MKGADVSHPSAFDSTAPSIAGISATIDQACSLNVAATRVQVGRTEVIADLEEMIIVRVFKASMFHLNSMMQEVLQMFRNYRLFEISQKTQNKPQDPKSSVPHIWPHRVIYYRDGVGEGQYAAVTKYEVDAIKSMLDNTLKRHITYCRNRSLPACPCRFR